MATLAEIRAKLKEQENKGGSNTGPSDNAIFPFWNMQEGQSSTIRFLPDANPKNDFFWQERLMIKLPFAGIKGQTDSRPTVVQVPCMEMYGEACPVLTEVRPWFKDPSMESMGRTYWKKRSYIFQNLVVESDMNEENKPENPIRRSIIGPQIFGLIKDALLDPDLEDLPTDYANGLDFVIKKTSKGNFADYSTSKWARRERPLSQSDIDAIEEHGLLDLSDFIPKQPDAVAVQVIKEMFEASVDGEPYDPDRWSQYFRPAGMSQATGDPNKTPAPAPKPVTTASEDVPFKSNEEAAAEAQVSPPPTAEPAASSSVDASDILAQIRKRQGA
jgi:hypothetical protein